MDILANEFEIEDEQLAQVFDERGTPTNVYGSISFLSIIVCNPKT